MLKSEKSVSPSLEVQFQKKKNSKKEGMLQFGSLRRSSSRLLHRGIREKKEFSNIVIDKNPKNPFLPRSEFQKKKIQKKK